MSCFWPGQGSFLQDQDLSSTLLLLLLLFLISVLFPVKCFYFYQ